MSEPITGDLTTGRYYRITVDPGDADPSLKDGDVLLCAVSTPNCIDPENMVGDDMGDQWFADYDAVDGSFRTIVSAVEEVEKPA